MGLDDNDLAKAGKLPADPKGDAKLVLLKSGEEPPRILTVRQLLEAGRDAARSVGSLRSCTTGLKDLDEATGGMRPGLAWLFMADTSWGKSSWLVMVADENLKRGRRVLIVTAEDDESIYGTRLLARRSRVKAKALRTGRLTAEDDDAIARTIAGAEACPVYLDARGKTIEWICEQVPRIVERERIDMVAGDYLQEMASAKPARDPVVDMDNRARMWRHTCKTAKVASVLFSQVTTEPGKKYLDKKSVRGSKAVSHGADVILCGDIAQEAITLKRRVNGFDEPYAIITQGEKFLKLDKCKNARVPQWIPLRWDDETASFDETVVPPTPDHGDDDWDRAGAAMAGAGF